ELQDDLRSRGFNVIGGSAFGDRLENDRAFAFSLLAEQSLNIARVKEFTSGDAAIADLRGDPRRCVFNFCDSAGETFLGALTDGSDVVALLELGWTAKDQRFILMDHVEGVETGVGAWFNGE